MQRTIQEKKLVSIYISRRLSLISSWDLRKPGGDPELIKRHNQIKANFKYFYINPDCRFVDYFLRKYAELSLVSLNELFQKNKEEIQALIKYTGYWFPNDLTCCKSCRTGNSSVDLDTIEKQRNKYFGHYVCEYCEKIVHEIDTVNLKNRFFTGTSVYKDHGIDHVSKKFLGFGGRKFLIKTTNGKIRITNNLFTNYSFDPLFHNKVKHRINSEVILISDFTDETLLKHLTPEELSSVRDQIIKADKLGHKTTKH